MVLKIYKEELDILDMVAVANELLVRMSIVINSLAGLFEQGYV